MTRTHRYQAFFVIEAESAFAIGSGERGFTVDRLIARDALGLPYLPGTSLVGVLRHELSTRDSEDRIKNLFGYQEGQSGQGSRIIVSSGHLIGENGHEVIEGLVPLDLNNGYYSYFQRLPERDHVRMTDKGAADTKNHGKFDEEVVHKGTRFAFRLELMGNDEDAEIWDQMLSLIHHPMFRVGAGTRRGFGKFRVISCDTQILDLRASEDLQTYLQTDNSLNISRTGWKRFQASDHGFSDWVHYQLELTPDNFFLFAAGYGDEEVDNKPKTESFFSWESGTPKLVKKNSYFLLPATSVKGALSHRVAYHFNLLSGITVGKQQKADPFPPLNPEEFVQSLISPQDLQNLDWSSTSERWEELTEQIENLDFEVELEKATVWQKYSRDLEDYSAKHNSDKQKPNIGEANEAVRTLFGYANDKENSGSRGHVIITDVYLPRTTKEEKVFSHVSIDRFTGGARDGMLFQQKVATGKTFNLDIYVRRQALEKPSVKKALEQSLEDLCEGRLALGGSTTKGHGRFSGTCTLKSKQA